MHHMDTSLFKLWPRTDLYVTFLGLNCDQKESKGPFEEPYNAWNAPWITSTTL